MPPLQSNFPGRSIPGYGTYRKEDNAHAVLRGEKGRHHPRLQGLGRKTRLERSGSPGPRYPTEHIFRRAMMRKHAHLNSESNQPYSNPLCSRQTHHAPRIRQFSSRWQGSYSDTPRNASVISLRSLMKKPFPLSVPSYCLQDRSDQAAVNQHRSAGDVAGAGRGQEGDQVGELQRFSHAAHGSLGGSLR